MEILLVVLIVALFVLLGVQLVASGVPTRRHRVDTEEEVGPHPRPDPGASRPAGPGAEAQDAGRAGTLHPPEDRADEGEGPAAEPPYRAGGAVDPGRDRRD